MSLSDYVVNYYNSNDYENFKKEHELPAIPAGDHRVRIESAVEKISSKGNEMIELTLAVSGFKAKLWYYLTLDSSSPEAQQRTNQKFGSIFESFNIPIEDFNLNSWVGHVGGVRVRHNAIDDKAEVHYFLPRTKVNRLRPWIEPDGSQPQADIDPNMVNFNGQSEAVPF